MSTYEIIDGQEYEVVEYPTHEEEKQFKRLLTKTVDALVPRNMKESQCDEWGWYDETEEGERVYDDYITEEITDKGKYHLQAAKIIFKNADDLDESDVDQIRGGLIQEAGSDFINGCNGRNDAQAGTLSEALRTLQSLSGLTETNTATANNPNTAAT